MPVIVVVVIVVVVGVAWLISAYNGLIGLKNQVANAWKQIDVQLKRRHDLIPNLVNTVKGAMQFERDTLDAVVTARNRAIAVQTGGGPAGPGVAATAAAESQLSGALGRLFAVVEAYPDLKATGNVAQLQEELTTTENKIAFARQLYNDTATAYNTSQRQFPTMLVAGIAGASPAELWEISDTGERENVAVDLSMAPRPAVPPPVAPPVTPPAQR
jgi:LemA protein